MTITIDIAKDFSRFPGPRYIHLGKHSGEKFRQDFLVPLFDVTDSVETIEIVLDGTEGYPVSFLDEAFGGLVRLGRYDPEIISKRLSFVANDPAFRAFKINAEKFLKKAIEEAAISDTAA